MAKLAAISAISDWHFVPILPFCLATVVIVVVVGGDTKQPGWRQARSVSRRKVILMAEMTDFSDTSAITKQM
jgi:hypothetical protein